MSPQRPISVETGAIAMAVPGLERLRPSPGSPWLTAAQKWVLAGTPIERTAAAMREPYLSMGPTRQGRAAFPSTSFLGS